jgi:hypothetical protein
MNCPHADWSAGQGQDTDPPNPCTNSVSCFFFKWQISMTQRRKRSSCLLDWMSPLLSPLLCCNGQAISPASAQVVPRHLRHKLRVSRWQVKKTESTLKTIAIVNIIFMSILHLYIYYRTDASSSLFHPGQKHRYLSNNMANSTLFEHDVLAADGVGTAHILQMGKAIGHVHFTNASMRDSGHKQIVAVNVTGRFDDSTALQPTNLTSKTEVSLPGRHDAQTSIKHADVPHLGGTQPRELLITRNEGANGSKFKHPARKKRKGSPKKAFAPQQQHQDNSEKGKLQNQHTHRIIFSPHYDDAVLSLGGMLSVNPANTTVITVFAGKPLYPVSTPYDMSCHFTNSHQALNARSAENRRSLELLGVRYRDLDSYVDYQYASVYWSWMQPVYTLGAGQRPTRVTYRRTDVAEMKKKRKEELRLKLAADIKKIVNSYVQDGTAGTHVEVYSSLGRAASDHPDHEILNLAIMDLALSMRNNSSVTWLFYEDFPYVLKLTDKNESIAAMSRVSELKSNFSAANNTMASPQSAQLNGSGKEALSLAALALAMRNATEKVQAKTVANLEAAIKEAVSWTNGEAVLVPKMHTYDLRHYQRKKSAIQMTNVSIAG